MNTSLSEMTYDSAKGRSALRRGRYSQPGAGYFLTVCADARRPRLAAPALAQAILDEASGMSADGTWTLRCASVMPDHIHLLIELGGRLLLGKTVQRLKARTSASLASMDVRWERDFFDRRIRPGDDQLAIFLYIYLNPYRAGLCARSARWPWYFCRGEDWEWFQDYLEMDLPPPEWLSL